MKAFLIALGTALLLTVPTDILPNPFFSREVPVRWWEYVAVAITVVHTYLWFALPEWLGRDANKFFETGNGKLGGFIGLTLFAVACPVCNKIVLLLVGTAGALGWWMPIQPYIALLSVLGLAVALWLRVRRKDCGPDCEI